MRQPVSSRRRKARTREPEREPTRQARVLRYYDSDEDSGTDAPSFHGDSSHDARRRSMASSPIRKILGKPNSWADPKKGVPTRRNSFRTPPIKQFGGREDEDARQFLNQLYTGFSLDEVDEEESLLLFPIYLEGRVL
jgi:hypothetical protein